MSYDGFSQDYEMLNDFEDYEGGDFHEDMLYEDQLYEQTPQDMLGDFEDYEAIEQELYEGDFYDEEASSSDPYSADFYSDELYEYEMEDYEADPFLGKFLKKAGRFIKKGVNVIKRSPFLKTLARVGASALGGALGGPAGIALANAVTGAVLREAEYEGEAEAEAELYESDLEFEDQGGSQEAYAAMEYEAERAVQADDELEASRAIRGMITKTPRLLRRYPHLRPVYPKIMRGSAAVAKTMRANPKSRWAIALLPVAIRRTLQQLARHRQINDRLIIQVFARNVAWVLANRSRATAALRRRSGARPAARRRPIRPMRRPGM